MSELVAETATAASIKACCADFYAGDWARLLLGDSFHPGGLALTEHLVGLLGIDSGSRVLDVACGRGDSAIHLARRLGCHVTGLDYSSANVAPAQHSSVAAGLEALTSFEHGDAERLPFSDGYFDAVICECSFCTFPDKPAAAREMARMLKPGGALGLSDLTRQGRLPSELGTFPAWLACIGDAQPIDSYLRLIKEAGLSVEAVEGHDEALVELVRTVKLRLLAGELASQFGRFAPPGVDFEAARALARAAEQAVLEDRLGYVLIVARKVDLSEMSQEVR